MAGQMVNYELEEALIITIIIIIIIKIKLQKTAVLGTAHILRKLLM